MVTELEIRRKLDALAPRLNEHTRRVWGPATEAQAIGYGGVSLVSRATGVSRRAIGVGLRKIDGGEVLPEGRVRRSGGGRQSVVAKQTEWSCPGSVESEWLGS